MRIFTAMEELIGHTPVLELKHIEKKYDLKARLFAKLESFNATGSAKDRIAREMIDDAERKGILKEGGVIIEPTSGNTGIGLAAVGVTRGYRVIIVMPDTFSEERRKLIRAYGAEIVLSPGAEGMAGAIRMAEELCAKLPGAFIPAQFDNPANAEAHYKTTGPELWEDMDGEIACFVAGIGTGGTVTGTGRYLKEKDPGIRVIAVEPASSPLLTEGKAGPHKIQGIGANFIPSVLDRTVYDEVIDVTDEDALKTGAMFGKTEGILCGISAGAALWAAIQQASREEYRGKNIAVLLTDGGDRYLSSEMYG